MNLSNPFRSSLPEASGAQDYAITNAARATEPVAAAMPARACGVRSSI
jgi:hypothetical protein